MITYKGLPAPIICDYLSREASKAKYAADTTFQMGKIEMISNTGTYVDAPFHRYEQGKDLSELPLEVLVDLEGLVFQARSRGSASWARNSSARQMCAARRCWCIPAGPGTGARISTSKVTPISRKRRRCGSRIGARPSWA